MEVPDEAAAARYRSDAAAAPPGREVVPVHDNIEEGEEQIDEPVSEGHQGKPKSQELGNMATWFRKKLIVLILIAMIPFRVML